MLISNQYLANVLYDWDFPLLFPILCGRKFMKNYALFYLLALILYTNFLYKTTEISKYNSPCCFQSLRLIYTFVSAKYLYLLIFLIRNIKEIGVCGMYLWFYRDRVLCGKGRVGVFAYVSQVEKLEINWFDYN